MKTPTWLLRVCSIVLAIGTFAAIMHNQHDVGIARDETVYMQYGHHYAEWWTGLFTHSGGPHITEQAITTTFGGPGLTDNNREHPPLMKTLLGLSHKLFFTKLHWTDELSADRLPTAALAAVLVVLVFQFAAGLWGLGAGLIAALLTILLPRAFFHSGLACFDAPITTLWFSTVLAYWRGLTSKKWQWGVGVIFGLALATKHNAMLLPVALGIHYMWIAYRGQVAAGLRGVRALGIGMWRHRPWMIIAMAVLGPLTLIAVWPWLWFHPFLHIGQWLGFHLNHVHYNFEYLGHNYNAPRFPWHVVIVTTLFTTPVVTLLGALIGAIVLAVRARRGQSVAPERAPVLLLVMSAAASMGPFFLGSTPIFGAEKHWAPAMPSLCIAAAIGIVWAARALAESLSAIVPSLAKHATVAAVIVVGGAAIAAAAVETFHAQPYALSNYNALAGGAPGGADLGMNRQFWGYSARGVLPFLAANAPAPGTPNAPVYTHDASPAWGMYIRDHLIPPTMPDSGSEYSSGIERSQWAIVIHEKHFLRHDYLIWKSYGTVAPVFVLRADGVPIVSVYHRAPAVAH